MRLVDGTKILAVSLVPLLAYASLAQRADSIYYRNFVRHSNGELCTHQPPLATFTVYVNGDESRVLTEVAPRWSIGGDPNIDGKGTFGVELANFARPALEVGDTVFVRFTCNETGEQGVLVDRVTAIPWLRFPLTLTLLPSDLPAAPQQLTLTKYDNGHRLVRWHPEPNLTYTVYRRTIGDTAFTGVDRMQYTRIASRIAGGGFTDTTAAPNRAYGYIVYAISASGVVSSHSEEVNEILEGSDLTIGWIARLPRIDYVWGSSQPDVDGWPQVGQEVVWQANVKNWASEDVRDVLYRWYLDGAMVADGTVDIPAGSYTTVEYPWTWTFERHKLKFVIDPENLVPEEEEGNNELSVYTDAISVGFYVEQTVYEYFHEYQKELRVHSNCWEDWAQRHVRRWNRMFAEAVYPETPQGVLDRIRIDKITIVPDGALPLAGGLPTNHPNRNDRTVDLQWGFPASLLSGGMYSNHSSATDTNPFYFEGSLLHELGHARYLIDLYGFNVHDDGNGNTVAIRENGQLIVGTKYMPWVGGDAVHYTPWKGLMNGQYTYIDRYSAAALNLIAGHRATLGNYNAPGNIGVFLQDLPEENRIALKDQSGNLLANADVRIYQAEGKAGDWYGKYFDDTPDLFLQSDVNGQVLVGRCPFDPDGRIEHTYGKSSGVAILRVEHEGRIGCAFLESTFFNLEYWRGHTSLGEYEVAVNLVEEAPSETADRDEQPYEYTLWENYPNPFNGTTILRYELGKDGPVSLRVFDVTGKLVTTLVDDVREAGVHQAEWNGRNAYGAQVSSGVYLCRLQSRGFVKTLKMILVR